MNSTQRQRPSIARSILVYTSICVISVVVAVAAVLAYDAKQHEIAWGGGRAIHFRSVDLHSRCRDRLSGAPRSGGGFRFAGTQLLHEWAWGADQRARRCRAGQGRLHHDRRFCRPSATALRATRPIRATWRGRPISSASISASADLAAWARSWCCAASLILRRNSSSTVSGRTISTAMSDHASKAERPSAFPGRASPTARPVPPSGCLRIRSTR